MFGYVKISENNISELDYETYKSYYCGLCRALGKYFQPFSRLSLNYDAVFLFILLSSVYCDGFSEKQYKCIMHPFSKINIIEHNQISKYCIHINVMLTYFKIKDDIADDKNFKAYAAEFLFRNNYKKSCVIYPELIKKITEAIDKLHMLETEKCANPDLCADCFAEMLGFIYRPDFIKDPITRRILYTVGYNLGRWIYLIDAIDDIENDYKKKHYNPFLYKYYEYLKSSNTINLFASYVFSQEENMLTYTLSSLSSAFELLDIKRNKGILENIIYPGLKNIQDNIKVKNEKK